MSASPHPRRAGCTRVDAPSLCTPSCGRMWAAGQGLKGRAEVDGREATALIVHGPAGPMLAWLAAQRPSCSTTCSSPSTSPRLPAECSWRDGGCAARSAPAGTQRWAGHRFHHGDAARRALLQPDGKLALVGHLGQAAPWTVGRRNGRGCLPFARALARSALKCLPWELVHTCLLRIPGWPRRSASSPSRTVVGLAGVWVLATAYALSGVLSPRRETLYDRAASAVILDGCPRPQTGCS